MQPMQQHPTSIPPVRIYSAPPDSVDGHGFSSEAIGTQGVETVADGDQKNGLSATEDAKLAPLENGSGSEGQMPFTGTSTPYGASSEASSRRASVDQEQITLKRSASPQVDDALEIGDHPTHSSQTTIDSGVLSRADSTASDPADALSSSIIAAAGGLVPETATERRHRRTIQRRQRIKAIGERGPRLTVLSINHDGSNSPSTESTEESAGSSNLSGNRGPTVECQLETSRNKTVTFKFDCADYVPGDIANNLVAENLLPETQAELFTEIIQEIVRQVKADPSKLPVVSQYFPSETPGSPVAHRPRDRERDSDLALEPGPGRKDEGSSLVGSAPNSPVRHRMSLTDPPVLTPFSGVSTVPSAPTPVVKQAPVRKVSRFLVSTVTDPVVLPASNETNLVKDSSSVVKLTSAVSEAQPGSEAPGRGSMVRIGSETVLSSLSPCTDKQARKISLPEPVSLAATSSEIDDVSPQAVQTIQEKSSNYFYGDEYAMGGSPVSGGTPLSGDSPAQHHTPENTVLPGQDGLHIKLTQQSSLEKQLSSQLQADAGGPQTIEDLQQKLVQLTSQPSELGIGGTPPSHPATPHMPLSYDTYMQTLQQKLASISMTGGTHVGPLSPHSTLHASGMQGTFMPAALEVLQPAGGIIGLEGVSLLPSEQQLSVQQFASPSLQSMQSPLTVVQPVTVLTTTGQNPATGATLLQQVTVTPVGDVSGMSSGVMSPNQTSSRDEMHRPNRPRPAAIDLADLEQELAKIHTGYRRDLQTHYLIGQSQQEGQDENVQESENAQDGSAVGHPERRPSRFQVSVVPEDKPAEKERNKSVPSNMGASPMAAATATAVRKGRFSVVTHPDPGLINLPNPSSPACTPINSPQDAMSSSPPEGAASMDPAVFHVLHMASDSGASEQRENVDDVPLEENEEYRNLLRRQQIELDAMQRRHREEVEKLRAQISARHGKGQVGLGNVVGGPQQVTAVQRLVSLSPHEAAAMLARPMFYQALSPIHCQVGQTGSLAGVAGAGAAGAGTGAGHGSTEDSLVYSTAPQSPVGSHTGSHSESLSLGLALGLSQSPPTSPARGRGSQTPDGHREVIPPAAAAAAAVPPAGAAAGAAVKTEGSVPAPQSADGAGSATGAGGGISIGASPLTGLRALHIAAPTGYYFQPTTMAPLLQSGMRFVYSPPARQQGSNSASPHNPGASNSSSIDLESPPSSPPSLDKRL